MTTHEEAEEKVRRARSLLTRSLWPASGPEIREALELTGELKQLRQFPLLTQVTDRVIRVLPNNAAATKTHAQGLIETGQPTAAIAVAEKALKALPSSHKEWSELNGLIGRAYKQIAIDTGNPHCKESRTALKQAFEAYHRPYKKHPKNTWHAINLVGIAAFAKRSGVPIPSSFDITGVAQSTIATIERKRKSSRDRWDAVTLAEANLALDNLDAVEKHLHDYLTNPEIQPFEVGSTLRQFNEVWGLRDTADLRKRGLVQALHTRMMQLPGAQLRLSLDDVTLQRKDLIPEGRQLEAILGTTGTQSFEWWKMGLSRACSVAAIYAGIDQRTGTGFAVSARDMKIADSDEVLVLTNFHVVNENGIGKARRPGDAQVVFEAIDAKKQYSIKEIAWSSPVERHDATLLRLTEQPNGVVAIPLAKTLPIVEPTAKVFIIGHPGGGGLEFSFQDNELLDHESKPNGRPAIPGVCRLHYRAPTEKGSSGSPVFNAAYWQGIGLHHEGGVLSRLNGKDGTYPANEGISLMSISEAISQTDA
ncbi:MAG: trypsin-like peptidase domain-containing protein [Nitrospira sp.]|nr:trypsin-like peptidase domain-containing protein [Nitrospira sp.]